MTMGRAVALDGAVDIAGIASRLRQDARIAEADIVEAGVLMASDPGLTARVESLVVGDGVPAAAALRTAAEESAAELAALPDPTLALRADDVRSLGRRASAHAAGGSKQVIDG